MTKVFIDCRLNIQDGENVNVDMKINGRGKATDRQVADILVAIKTVADALAHKPDSESGQSAVNMKA